MGIYRLIGINTESISYPALDAALTTDRHCVVMGHVPLDECSLGDQAMLRDRFRTYHVPLYLAGHGHHDSQTINLDTGTMLIPGQRMPAYRFITLHGYEVQSIEWHQAQACWRFFDHTLIWQPHTACGSHMGVTPLCGIIRTVTPAREALSQRIPREPIGVIVAGLCCG